MADKRDSYSNADLKETSKDGSSEKSEEPCFIDAAFERRTMRYVDWRILPLLALLYSFALIDRVNLGAAYTAGMAADLGLKKGSRYSIVSCLYFVPHILLQLPGTVILRKFGARNWLTFIVIGWGAVELGMGFVPSWGWLILTRLLLGCLESSFFASMVFIISTWYKRHEVQTRLGAFTVMANTMGGISPLLAYAFSLLNGKLGIRGWRWIFIIEGAITIALGLMTCFFIPDFPDQNRFLTSEQTALVLKRIEDDRGDSIPDSITREKVFKHLGDWTLWAYGMMFLCTSVSNYAEAYFISIILEGLGYSAKRALLLSNPPSRTVQSALTVSLGAASGIIATTVYRAKDAPHYRPGLSVSIGAQCLLIIIVGMMTWHFNRLNRLSREGKLKKPLEGQPGFFYTL
ncbi:hypothetical protein H0H81_002991 [Sphagnurus paluster]|uniref:Major facilitator superfamily (MFS) profile domain-containing protein n=1 Tax=Sphagnurus paluster TaxID=117069 RepID=A0A9P7FZA6_9AGAR|nr:hypothetical protein H0H81_002991 [Sphagnurus paluster]